MCCKGFRDLRKTARTSYNNVPNVAPYQLGYTRIFNCHDYTTVRAKIKVFLVCGHLCGQSQFLPRFCCLEKSSKRPRCKGFRALAVPIVDRRKIAPKPPTLPTVLIPVIGQGKFLPCPFILQIHSAKSSFFSVRHTFVPARAMANTNQKMHMTRG